ncbi:MAG: metallophosphoesterase [Phycisphaerae bacterium]|nr:metallophosphoesterase [Phycisphaerae bacterium]
MRRREFLGLSCRLGIVTLLGCNGEEGLLLPPRESEAEQPNGLTLLTRLVHVTDTHIVDEESPARFAGAHVITRSAWRPYESYSTQLLDGIIRTVNRIHAAGRTIDFLLHTGDACDNVQSNELAWFLGVMDGAVIDPRSGPDERAADARPVPALDPHTPFPAQGLYQRGRHGERALIPWYFVPGNHDEHSLGVFPICESPDGQRTVPLPLDGRPGLVLPVRLDPSASFAYGNVTPAEPGPPCLFVPPRAVEPNPERAFFSRPELIRALFTTTTEPAGHGFEQLEGGPSWYSARPVPGVRLIGLDTTDAAIELPGGIYFEGALSRSQLTFLQTELEAARELDEIVIVATHHPSAAFMPLLGSAAGPVEFRDLLRSYPNVVLHLAGHRHRNRVTDRLGYLEIETCSTLDLPQEGRLIELWRNAADGNVVVAYEMFSHLDDALPALGNDPLRALREEARSIARADKNATARQKRFDPSGEDPAGTPRDRDGVLLPRRCP